MKIIRKIMIFMVCICVGFSTGVFTSMKVSAKVDKFFSDSKMTLGDKYLLELDYEQAVITFGEAIEIEPRQVAAYIGLSDAYMGLGKTQEAVDVLIQGIYTVEILDRQNQKPDEKSYLLYVKLSDLYQSLDRLDSAAETLKRGWDILRDDRLEDKILNVYLELYKQYMEKKDYDKALDILESAYDMTQNQKIKDEIDVLKELIAVYEGNQSLLEQLYQAGESDDTDRIVMLMNTTEYQQLLTSVRDVFYYPQKDGKALAVYANTCLYYGQFKDGKREGQGIWIKAEPSTSNVYKGLWSMDKPNGQGTVTSSSHSSDGNRRMISSTSGIYKDGKEEGAMTLLSTQNGQRLTFHYQAAGGILQPMPDAHVWTDGRYTVATAIEDSSNYCIDDGTTEYGVYGFAIGSLTINSV